LKQIAPDSELSENIKWQEPQPLLLVLAVVGAAIAVGFTAEVAAAIAAIAVGSATVVLLLL